MGSPPRPAGVRKGPRVEVLWVSLEGPAGGKRVWGCASLPLTAVRARLPCALGVCLAEAPSRFRRGRERLAAPVLKLKRSNRTKQTPLSPLMHEQLVYSKRGTPAPKKTKVM